MGVNSYIMLLMNVFYGRKTGCKDMLFLKHNEILEKLMGSGKFIPEKKHAKKAGEIDIMEYGLNPV